MPQKFPKEFKRDVANVTRRGDLTILEVAADFDVSVESVRGWMRHAHIDDGIVDAAVGGQRRTTVLPPRAGRESHDFRVICFT